MRGNPEFLRNLWLEITPWRLIAIPSLIGAIFLVGFLINGRVLDSGTATVAILMYAAIVLIWGSRVASESVVQEIGARTWDGQRMSALSPLSLAVGKLFGSTVHVWYGGLICLALYALSYGELIPTDRLAQFVLLYLGAGILCHAIGVLVSLQAVQKRREFGRVQVMFYQFLGLIAVIPVLYIAQFEDPLSPIYKVTTWYGHVSEQLAATVVWLYAYALWAMIGVWRLMRTEVLMRNGPWVWLGFVAFVVIHIAGLRFLPDEVGRVLPSLTGKVAAGFLVLALLSYIAALSEPKSRLVFRRLRQSLQIGDWNGFLGRLPLCIPTVALVLIAAATLLRIGVDRIELFTFPINFRLMVAAIALFVVRDVCLIIYISLLRASPRADATAFMLLALSYTLIPVTLSGIGLDPLAAFFWPMRDASATLTLLPVAIEVLVAGILLWRQWRRAVADDEDVY